MHTPLQLGAYTHSRTHAHKHAHKPLANLALTLSDAHWPTPTMHIHILTCVPYTCTHTRTHTHIHTHTYTCAHIHPTTLLNTDTSLQSDTCVRTVAHIYQAYPQVLPNDIPHSEHTGSLTHSGIHMHIKKIYKPPPSLTYSHTLIAYCIPLCWYLPANTCDTHVLRTLLTDLSLSHPQMVHWGVCRHLSLCWRTHYPQKGL